MGKRNAHSEAELIIILSKSESVLVFTVTSTRGPLGNVVKNLWNLV